MPTGTSFRDGQIVGLAEGNGLSKWAHQQSCFDRAGRQESLIQSYTQAASTLQQAFLDQGAVQCGYCTPGMILSCEGLLLENPESGEAEIRQALAGNLCRCTGFQSIVAAVKHAAAARSAAAAQ